MKRFHLLFSVEWPLNWMEKLSTRALLQSLTPEISRLNFLVEFPGSIGPIGQHLGFKDRFKNLKGQKRFYAYLHSVYNSEFLGGSKLRVLIKYFHLFNLLFWSCEGLMDNDKACIIVLNFKQTSWIRNHFQNIQFNS